MLRIDVQDPDPDLASVRGIAEGDERAFREFLDRHLDKVVRIAGRLLGNSADAEEVAQEVFARVWQNAGRWQAGQARFSTWLYRVTVNLCNDRLRRRRSVTLEAPDEEPSGEPSPETVMQRTAVAKRVQQALTELPERQRAAIVLCHFEEVSNIDAATVMEVSVEAMESLLARGRRRLREILMDEAAYLLGELK